MYYILKQYIILMIHLLMVRGQQAYVHNEFLSPYNLAHNRSNEKKTRQLSKSLLISVLLQPFI